MVFFPSVQQMKKGLPRDTSVPSINSPTPERRKLRRGETLESSGPFSICSSPEGSPPPGYHRDKERVLSHCHTVDTEHPSFPQRARDLRHTGEVEVDTHVAEDPSDTPGEPDIHTPDVSSTQLMTVQIHTHTANDPSNTLQTTSSDLSHTPSQVNEGD